MELDFSRLKGTVSRVEHSCTNSAQNIEVQRCSVMGNHDLSVSGLVILVKVVKLEQEYC